jgi:prolipoprotein diacylglyceryltransferase
MVANITTRNWKREDMQMYDMNNTNQTRNRFMKFPALLVAPSFIYDLVSTLIGLKQICG